VTETSDMPELRDDLAARRMYGVGDFLPPSDLLIGPDAGRQRITASLRGNIGRLSNDQACRSTLRIIGGLKFPDHTVVCRTAARQRCHDDAVGEFEPAQADGRKEIGLHVLISHLSCLKSSR